MQNFIINSFILQNKNTLTNIYNYILLRYDKSVEINDIKIKLTTLIKKNIIFFNNNFYELTKEGNVILNDHKYYYSKIIIKFYKNYNKNYNKNLKKYELKEIREEQKNLRKYLINTKQQICIICDKNLPLCLLETAHIKPRCILNDTEKNDKNIVEFMCRYCHNLYDNGFLAVNNGELNISTFIDKFDLDYNKNKQITYYNSHNKQYFDFHYKYIYKRD
jgi:hypothetical protein